MNRWFTLFSQTGSEILKVAEQLNREPDLIITNQPLTSPKINKELLSKYGNKIAVVDSKPRPIDYLFLLHGADIVTLHGWLRIIPSEACCKFNIFNGHPGLILPDKYPELKGKDPQKRAWEAEHKEIGCVIHKVTPQVDEGDIIAYNIINNNYKTLDEMCNALHDLSIDLWVKFLTDKVGLI